MTQRDGQSEVREGKEAPGTGDVDPIVAVVVPTYNEAENLPLLARRLFQLKLPNTRLIVVDDGSPDGTGEVATTLASEYGERLILIQRGRKMGLGTAYVDGFSRALAEGAQYVVQMDADLSHSPENVPELIRRLGEADVVVGSRYVLGGGFDDSWGPPRRLLSRAGNLGIRATTGVRVRDTTSGFKAFRSRVLASLDFAKLRSKGFAFQAEVASACQRKGFSVVEHPITFAARANGESKMSVGIVLEAIWRLLPLRWKRSV